MQFGSVWLIGEKKKKLIWCGYGAVLRPLAGWPTRPQGHRRSRIHPLAPTVFKIAGLDRFGRIAALIAGGSLVPEAKIAKQRA